MRAYTSAGAGPFSPTLKIVTTGRSSNDHVYCSCEKSYYRILANRCVSLGGNKPGSNLDLHQMISRQLPNLTTRLLGSECSIVPLGLGTRPVVIR